MPNALGNNHTLPVRQPESSIWNKAYLIKNANACITLPRTSIKHVQLLACIYAAPCNNWFKSLASLTGTGQSRPFNQTLAIKKEPSMYCSQCGAETSTSARFCQSCGAELKSQKDVEIAHASTITPSKPKEISQYSESVVAGDASAIAKDQSKTFMGGIHYPWRRAVAGAECNTVIELKQ